MNSTHIITLATARELVKARQAQTSAARKSLEEMRALVKSKWERKRKGLSLESPALVASVARVRLCAKNGSVSEGLIRIHALRDWLATAPKGEQWAFCDVGGQAAKSAPEAMRLQRGSSAVSLYVLPRAQYKGEVHPFRQAAAKDCADAESFGAAIELVSTGENAELRIAGQAAKSENLSQ